MFSTEHMFFFQKNSCSKDTSLQETNQFHIAENCGKNQMFSTAPWKSCDFYLGTLTLEENHRNPRNGVNIETYGTNRIRFEKVIETTMVKLKNSGGTPFFGGKNDILIFQFSAVVLVGQKILNLSSLTTPSK